MVLEPRFARLLGSPRAAGIAAALVLGALAVVEVDVVRSLSITFDEQSHIGAGFSYVTHGDVVLNPEHPPLVKLIAGATIAALGVKEGSAGPLLALARARPAEALGGALAVKFSAICLAAGLAVAAGVAAKLGPERDAAGPADPFGRARTGTRLGAVVLACLVVAALAVLILSVSYLGHAPFSAYRRGLASIYGNASSTYRGFCLGRYEPRFWYYFLVAVALKAPLGTLGLLLAALVVSVAARRARTDARTELCLHVPALVLFVATSVLAAPIGSRYVIPAIVFLLVSAGRLAPWAGASAVRWTVIGLALVANLVHVEREHPFHASSVNALGGAPGSFYRLLDDSNQDWGQGLKALARWQRERDVPRITLLSSLLVDGARPPRRLRRGG